MFIVLFVLRCCFRSVGTIALDPELNIYFKGPSTPTHATDSRISPKARAATASLGSRRKNSFSRNVLTTGHYQSNGWRPPTHSGRFKMKMYRRRRRNVSNARLDGFHFENNKRAEHIAINCHFVLLLCVANVILLLSDTASRSMESKNEICALRSAHFPFVFCPFHAHLLLTKWHIVKPWGVD